MSHYDESMRDFILSCKSAALNGLMPTQKNFLKELCFYWSEELRYLRIDKIVPIPAHPIRSLMQSDLAWFLARYLSTYLRLGEVESILKRKIFIQDNFYKAQKNLSAVNRKNKISQQYFVPKDHIKKFRVFLVDDVCTTGSTLKYCRQILHDAGHEVVGAIVLSKVNENKKTEAPFQELRYL